MRLRTFSSSEPEPQAKSNTLSSRSFLPVFGSWLSSVTMPERMLGNLLRRVKLARLLAGTGGELADQVFVGIAQRVGVGGELRQPFGDLADDRAELGVAVFVFLAELVRAEIDLREQALEGALERFVLDVFEACLQRVEQFAVLRAGQVGDAGPEVIAA